MKLHEYQAKEVLAKFGAATMPGIVCTTAEECEKACLDLGGGLVVVKAQVHAGGRGKAGGVKLAKGPAEAREKGAKICGMTLISPQTGPQGVVVKKVLVTPAADIAKEMYVAITLDRAKGLPCLMACAEGGVEIEEIAAHRPEAILREHFHPDEGLQGFQARRIAFGLGLRGPLVGECVKLLQSLARAFVSRDATILCPAPPCPIATVPSPT